MAYMNIAHSSSAGVTATSNASAHTKGNWAQGIASTSEDGDGIVLFLQHGVGGQGARARSIPITITVT